MSADPTTAEIAYLAGAASISRAIIAINRGFDSGDDTEARGRLQILAENVAIGLPGLERIVAAKLQTAEARDRTESTIARVLGKAAEHSNTPANDHDTPPPEPAPFVA